MCFTVHPIFQTVKKKVAYEGTLPLNPCLSSARPGTTKGYLSIQLSMYPTKATHTPHRTHTEIGTISYTRTRQTPEYNDFTQARGEKLDWRKFSRNTLLPAGRHRTKTSQGKVRHIKKFLASICFVACLFYSLSLLSLNNLLICFKV